MQKITQALYKLDSCPVWLRRRQNAQKSERETKTKKKKEYMTKPTEMETQGAEGKNAFFSSSSPLGDLGAFGDQNTEAETTNTGALSNAGEQGFLKACTKSHRSAPENTHRSRQWHQLCCLHYEETNHFAQ